MDHTVSDLPANGTAAGARGHSVQYVDIEKHYGPVRALLPTSFQVRSGEFFSIIGPSGSGKTTLLAATAGFVPPSAGRILVDGRDIVGTPPFRRNIGMVFQNYSLFPQMSVAENIAFPLRMRKRPRTEIAKRVERMLAMVRLDGFGDRHPAQLSGGQQQRVALARAAIYDPLLLLMDEPLSALDKNLREEMQDELRQFQQALGTTVVYVTHDQSEAASMSHRIAIMNGGRIEQIGTPRELYERPTNRFVASFLGEANIMEAKRVEPRGSGCLIETGAGLRLAAEAAPINGRACACIRPETIAIAAAPMDGDNAFPGEVIDVTYTAGSVRTRIALTPECVVTQRAASERGAPPPEPGTRVHVLWRARDTLLVADR